MIADPSGPRERPPVFLVALLRSRPSEVPATWALVLILVLASVFVLLHDAAPHQGRDAFALRWGANFGPATADGEWWRLGSAMFLHLSALHIALNAWALWDCGRLVERLFGPARFVALFLLSGLFGNLVSLALHGNDAVSSGASGGIFGLYGGLMARLWRERASLDQAEFRWFFGGAAVFSAAAIALGATLPAIDNGAHAGGLLAGTLLGVAFHGARPSSRHLRLAALAALAAATTLAALAVRDPAYRWRDELEARGELREFSVEEQRIRERWRAITAEPHTLETFEALADRIEADIVRAYQESFESLSTIDLPPSAPTYGALDAARRYAARRSEASQLLVEGLRSHDGELIREALERAKETVPSAPATPSGKPR